MKDVENVTGRMGEGEAVTPVEEASNAAAAPTPEATATRSFADDSPTDAGAWLAGTTTADD